jgi:hypothetical protein
MSISLNDKYFYNSGFDRSRLSQALTTYLPRIEPAYHPTVMQTAERLIVRLGSDARVTDIRFMAYMLATAGHEAREINKFAKPIIGRGGLPVVDRTTGLPKTKEVSLWSLFNPIDESGRGAGLGYFEAVKVQRITDGALVTEKDGNRFKVSELGRILSERSFSRASDRGSLAGGPVHANYLRAEGTEHQYFGRGLVQLTWWDGYAASGVALGYGLELLFNPERVKEFDIAYEILVKGMLTGKGYGNGTKCSDHFNNNQTNYVSARGMVNGTDDARHIANLALIFEALLMDAKTP